MNEEYVVKQGDTLYGISKQFGVSVKDLMDANNMKDDVVVLGETMIIPEEKPTTYTVKAGDNLYNIAKDFGVSVDDILNANNVSGDMLTIGEVLVIPSVGSDPSFINYIVKSGDNLYDIATKYNTTVSAIKSLNNIGSNELNLGDVIKVPTVLVSDIGVFEEGTYKEYTVKAGDSLYSIATSFGVSVDDIKNINNLTSNSLTVGEVLMIGEYIPNPLIGLSCYKDSDEVTYIVKKGDKLYDIAREYNTSVSAIKSLNNLDNNDLNVGQILKIRKEIS